MVGLDARLGVLGLALGQVDDVRVELENVRWSRWRARRATVVCRDVHVNPPAVLVASPDLPRGIELTGVEQCDDHFVLTGAAPVLRERLTLGQLADVPRRLASIQSRTRSDTTSGISSWGT